MSKFRKCLCCEREYKYCGNCGQDASKPKWMTSYDTEACKDLFNAISGYNMGIVPKERVNEVLDKYGITDFSRYKESIRNKLNELFPKKETKKVELDVELTTEVEQPVVADEPVIVEDTDAEVTKRRNSTKRKGDIQD